ncbi:MAG TPA: TonB-dependent receptor [Bryobacteraceae bacterium]|nr:TonB-dependent receptor [Bryobacteraceae bacterium]
MPTRSDSCPFSGAFLTSVALVFLPAFLLLAQAPTGEIRLQVNDPSGAGMQVSGKLESRGLGVDRKFQTDSQGQAALGDLPLGRYRLEISKLGFVSQSVVIAVGSAAPVEQAVTMKLASQASKVEVVSETPLAGTDLTRDQIAAPVQTATADDLQNSGALDLGDFLNRELNGIFLNEMQGNPFQPDVNYRGYTASPLLGTPEGISVYVDGVRQNQPFGDVVSWDLIPKDAISEVTLVPGSDPLFGLNTLGGALSIQTKNGIANPGWAGHVLYGSSGRKEVEGEWGGGKATGFNWFLSGLGFHESGWRYDSPSDIRQGFARLGWRTTKTDLALTLSYAYNTLLGNGVQDYRLLAANYSSAYSVPDSTANRSPSFNFIARHTFSDELTFSGNAWFRNIRTEAINPNYNDDAAGNSIYQPTPEEQAVLSAAGYTGFPTGGADISNTPFPKWPCIAEALTPGGSPDSTCDGVNIYSKEAQNEYGFSGQFTWITSPTIGRNQFAAGALVDRNNITYTQTADFAYVNPNYTLTSVPAWQDGSTVDANGNPVNTQVGLNGHSPNWSLYFADTLTLWKKVNVTFSGRYNYDTVHNLDLLNPVAGTGSLTGDYTFQRFNPAVGITWSPISSVNAYARFSQGSRAPTSIELGCADASAPCSLPNSLSSDPPLQQVVTDTWEAGLRGKPEIPFFHNLSWNAGAFRDENHNDILFIAAPQTGTGYFQNFARTLREGFDADLDGRVGPVTWGLDWTFLSATYESTETLDGSANNTNSFAMQGFPGLPGTITVHPGNRIPLIPKQTGKAYAIWQATAKLGFEFDEVANSSSYARGNENNAYTADGVYYLGPGVSPGYAITNIRAHYDLTRHLQLALQVDNLLNREYYTAAWLSNTALNAQGAVQSLPFPIYTSGPYAGSAPAESATFFAPGPPRRAWVELRLRF